MLHTSTCRRYTKLSCHSQFAGHALLRRARQDQRCHAFSLPFVLYVEPDDAQTAPDLFPGSVQTRYIDTSTHDSLPVSTLVTSNLITFHLSIIIVFLDVNRPRFTLFVIEHLVVVLVIVLSLHFYPLFYHVISCYNDISLQSHVTPILTRPR